ncbi:uncharacterized protein LOC110820508 [Carica papaya]|uniref:uncharacterized protein LOC110820508 n=1 Tax=Carica papaya TaxID=3649 RepID=UPI000B8CDD02|nr:uncharacterized protein LOC110820508 [Carica papaya]
MALTIANGGGGGRILRSCPTERSYAQLPIRRHVLFPFSSRTLHVASAAKKLSSRTGRFDSRNRRSSITTKEEEDEQQQPTVQIEDAVENVGVGADGNVVVDSSGVPMPELPGQEPDFWEGQQWDAFGFVVQYLWAFGIVFALIACGIAVATYNEGATDFKETPAYKESIQSRELLDEPEASNSDVFESNPTEVAPSLE